MDSAMARTAALVTSLLVHRCDPLQAHQDAWALVQVAT